MNKLEAKKDQNVIMQSFLSVVKDSAVEEILLAIDLGKLMGYEVEVKRPVNWKYYLYFNNSSTTYLLTYDTISKYFEAITMKSPISYDKITRATGNESIKFIMEQL